MIERFLANSLNGRETSGGNASEHGDHLAVTVFGALQPLADLSMAAGKTHSRKGASLRKAPGW